MGEGAPAGAQPRLTLATKVTLVRLLGIPVYVGAIAYYRLSLSAGAPNEAYRVAALGIFLAGALTDALDGFLARSRGEVTRLGQILDPLADKSMLMAAMLTLTAPSLPALHPQIPLWFTLAVISRDVLLAVGAYVIHHLTGHVEVRPCLTGKLATALQMTCVVWVLADFAPAPFHGLAMSAVAFTIWSGVRYVADGWRQLAHPPRRPAG